MAGKLTPANADRDTAEMACHLAVESASRACSVIENRRPNTNRCRSPRSFVRKGNNSACAHNGPNRRHGRISLQTVGAKQPRAQPLAVHIIPRYCTCQAILASWHNVNSCATAPTCTVKLPAPMTVISTAWSAVLNPITSCRYCNSMSWMPCSTQVTGACWSHSAPSPSAMREAHFYSTCWHVANGYAGPWQPMDQDNPVNSLTAPGSGHPGTVFARQTNSTSSRTLHATANAFGRLTSLTIPTTAMHSASRLNMLLLLINAQLRPMLLNTSRGLRLRVAAVATVAGEGVSTAAAAAVPLGAEAKPGGPVGKQHNKPACKDIVSCCPASRLQASLAGACLALVLPLLLALIEPGQDRTH